MSRIDVDIGTLFPIDCRCRLAIAADGAYHLMDLSLEIDMHTHGIGNSTVVFGDIFSFCKFLFNLVVLRQIFHNAHLRRFFRLDESCIIAPRELC
uniref:hypothetical protein n=1 Tax=Phocaeicola coprocola TaxID=310298 RepID=UPI0022E8A2B0|nr:hypothetical protein [Phocaeicola coprocola]